MAKVHQLFTFEVPSRRFDSYDLVWGDATVTTLALVDLMRLYFAKSLFGTTVQSTSDPGWQYRNGLIYRDRYHDQSEGASLRPVYPVSSQSDRKPREGEVTLPLIPLRERVRGRDPTLTVDLRASTWLT